jgi:protein-S-isoprenylcysteine O-methyltransferase Ste14
MADSPEFHRTATWVLIVLAAITFVAVSRINAPYGRHERANWGPTMSARLGWIVMETPAVLVFAWVYLHGQHRFETVPLILLGMWQFHYVQRTYVFPFRMRNGGKTMPVIVCVMGLGFQLFNAYVNARWISHYGSYPGEWLGDPRLWIGAALFLGGWLINFKADTMLFALREPGESKGYKIPRGWLYEYVSCPNYLGEILEWCGWALATWSLAGLGFAFYTIANIGPRARANHRWYRETFEDYPKQRKALIPYVV